MSGMNTGSAQQKHRGQFDVVIVGAGIAGSALACALGDTALRVALVEVQPLPTAMPAITMPGTTMPNVAPDVLGFDARVSALTAASTTLLDQLGAWELIRRQRACGYREMFVWDAEGTGSIHFDCAEIHQPVLGHIVENRLVTCALAQQLPLIGNVSVLAPQVLQSLAPRQGGGYHLQLESGLAIEADLVVGADGAMSVVRKLAGLKTREWDYGHNAIVATVQTEKPHALTAWQRFMPSGPLALLPLDAGDGGQQFCSIVWSADTGYAQQLMALDDDTFRATLAAAFEHRLGDITAISKRFMFPLRQRHAVDYVAPGIALIGDAAHTIHPLAGQGINLGLLDVAALAQELKYASQRGLSCGDASVLRRYQRSRKGHNLLMMGVMEGFKRLFEQPALPLRWLRNEGLRQVDAKPWLKREIMRQAMGL